MMTFRNILMVPLVSSAGPPPTLDDVVAFAEQHQAHLAVADVVPEVPALQRPFRLADRRSITDLAVAALRDELQSWMEPFQSRVPVSVSVDVGRRIEKVVERVQQGGHDMVLIAADDNVDHHTTVRRLLRACPRPVLVVQPGLRSLPVLVAVDPDDRLELNAHLLEIGRDHALYHGTELHVVHAWAPFEEAILLRSKFSPIGTNEFNQFAAQIEAVHQNALAELLEQAGIDAAQRHCFKGAPVDAVVDTAERIDAGLIVMGTAGRHGMEAILVGNTAERVLPRTKRSILVMRPPGFEPSGSQPLLTR